MSHRHGAHPAILWVAGLALVTAVVVQVARDRAFPARQEPSAQFLYLRSPEALKRIALGFDALAADVYWIRAIQHFGGDRLSQDLTRPKYELLFPLLDLTTSLDPHFTIAYRFGAIFLSEPYPGGAGRPDLAIALLQKGIGAEPTNWKYYHDVAFVHYWTLGDYEAAADWFRRAAAQPNAPEWLLPMAASVLTAGRDRASARQLWSQMRTAEHEYVRNAAARALVQLDALDQIDALSAKIAAAPRPAGPYSWISLARAGVLEGIPVDPTGTPYDIDPATGTITVSRESPLFPMPRHVRR